MQNFDFDFLAENIVINDTFKHNIIKFASLNINNFVHDYGEEKLYYQGGTFNSDTHMFELSVKSEKLYRTVERYVQRNYERRTIYSPLKTKTKYIDKKIKINNSTLENLENYDDDIIMYCASHIVIKINDKRLVPHWFIRKWLGRFYTQKIDLENEKSRRINSQFLIDKTNYETKLPKLHNLLQKEQKN